MVFPVDRSHIFPPNIWAVAHKNQNNRSHEISILQNLEMFCKLFAKGICTLCVFTPIFSNIYARWAKNQYHWTNVLYHSWHRLLTFVITINQNAPLRKGAWKLAFFCIGAFTYSISTPLFTKLDCILCSFQCFLLGQSWNNRSNQNVQVYFSCLKKLYCWVFYPCLNKIFNSSTII